MTGTYIKSELLTELGIVNGVSLRVESKPALFSMKMNGTADGVESKNRREFFADLGFDESSVVKGQQVHGDNVAVAESATIFPDTDSVLTRRENLLLTVSIADCVPILLFDKNRKIIAAVHSGWKGTEKNIVGKTMKFFREELNSKPDDLVAFIGPSAGVCCYEVGDEVAQRFPDKYRKETGKPGKSMLDLRSVIASQLFALGVSAENVEISRDCTICNLNYHSFRRDGESSGRMLAAIAMK